LRAIADWVDVNMNIYSSTSPSWFAIIVYFILIIVFTFFYTLIQFNPDKIADSIQKR
jgi:preprotein translocase subunit SecY